MQATQNRLTFYTLLIYIVTDMKTRRARLAAVDIAECALFAALMVAGAYIEIPLPVMPITFQTVFAVLSGLMLGWKKGMIAMATYAIMGLIGIPVFTNGGGIFYVIKPSFGYILGFIAGAGVAGIYYNRHKKLWIIILLALCATLVDYVTGIAYFIAVWEITDTPNLWSSVLSFNLIYLPKDIILAVLAAFLSRAVTPKIIRLHYKVKNADSD